MSEQPELNFERLAGKGPEVEKFQVDEMIAALRGREWRTAKDLGAHRESDKRLLRAIAESSEGQIISGQRGYRLTLEATVSEIAETAWLKSQGKKMIQRWLAIQRVAHPILAGVKS
jgi:hypothetical protein